MKLNYQSDPGQPGSFPLPNSGEPGQAFAQAAEAKGHPSARRAMTGAQKLPAPMTVPAPSQGAAK